MTIIALSGYAGSGKDTLGRELTRDHGFTRVAFADAMKQGAAEHYGFPVALAHSTEGKRMWLHDHAMPIHQALISFGEMARRKDPDVWIRPVLAKIDKTARVVITDCRFKHEVASLISAFGRHNILVVRVTRPDHPREVKSSSETQLDTWPFDVVVTNEEGVDAHEMVLQLPGKCLF